MNRTLLEGRERRKKKEATVGEIWINIQPAPGLPLSRVIKELAWTHSSACSCDSAKVTALPSCLAPFTLKHACAQGVSVRWLLQPLPGLWVSHGQHSQPCCWCLHRIIRPGRCSQLPQTGTQWPPSHRFCHGVLWLVQYQLLLTARDLLPSAAITCLGHLWATHPPTAPLRSL